MPLLSVFSRQFNARSLIYDLMTKTTCSMEEIEWAGCSVCFAWWDPTQPFYVCNVVMVHLRSSKVVTQEMLNATSIIWFFVYKIVILMRRTNLRIHTQLSNKINSIPKRKCISNNLGWFVSRRENTYSTSNNICNFVFRQSR